MPRSGGGFPKYPSRPHSSGQARISYGGRSIYLGPWGSPESHQAYTRMLAEHEASGTAQKPHAGGLLVGSLLAAFARQGEITYEGAAKEEYGLVRKAIFALYDLVPITEFGPRAAKAVRQRWIDAGNARKTCNDRFNKLRSIFRWGVENELVPETIYRALMAIKPVPYGQARDTERVKSPNPAHVAAALEQMPPMIRAIAQLEILTGARGGEIQEMRPTDLETDSDVWVYSPKKHKTKYRGKARRIFIGPPAQEVLRPWLKDVASEEYVFSPARFCKSEAAWRRPPGERYHPKSYYHAVRKACERAGVPHFSPHQLRHLAAEAFERHFGYETTRILLGHSNLNVTKIYAPGQEASAIEAARAIGWTQVFT